jgi:hypothetical protein
MKSSLSPKARRAARQTMLTAIVLAAVFRPVCLGAKDECARISKMRVYSNAVVSEESGDLVGYELALGEKGSTVEALLFVYEGAPRDGVSLPGRISGKKVTIEGTWAEHLVEYPSKKEIVQTSSVKIEGTLEAERFRGAITINGGPPQQVRLKRVALTWMCTK